MMHYLKHDEDFLSMVRKTIKDHFPDHPEEGEAISKIVIGQCRSYAETLDVTLQLEEFGRVIE